MSEGLIGDSPWKNLQGRLYLGSTDFLRSIRKLQDNALTPLADPLAVGAAAPVVGVVSGATAGAILAESEETIEKSEVAINDAVSGAIVQDTLLLGAFYAGHKAAHTLRG